MIRRRKASLHELSCANAELQAGCDGRGTSTGAPASWLAHAASLAQAPSEATTSRDAPEDSSPCEELDDDMISSMLTQRVPEENGAEQLLQDVLDLLEQDVELDPAVSSGRAQRNHSPETFRDNSAGPHEVLQDKTNQTNEAMTSLRLKGMSKGARILAAATCIDTEAPPAESWEPQAAAESQDSDDESGLAGSGVEDSDTSEAGPPVEQNQESESAKVPAPGNRKAGRITDFFQSRGSAPNAKKLKGSLAPSATRPERAQRKLPGPRIRKKAVVRGGAAEWETPQGEGASNRSPDGYGACPVWEQIPGTPFRVDGFSHLTSECHHWFLTHFHTDHYKGLTKGFRQGLIYCSEVTARLAKLKIGLGDDILRVLAVNDRVEIEGVGVTFLDANHCPGAVMILFEPPNGEAVLHTGDCRWIPAFLRVPQLSSGGIHTLILDTTYCDPKFQLPTQEEAVQLAVDAVLAESFNPKTLILVGTYGIGKEKVLFEIARALRRKVFVTPARRKMLECMGFSEDDMSLLTTNEAAATVHDVPLWSVSSSARMQKLANFHSHTYTTLVAICPTGWVAGRQGSTAVKGRRSQRGSLVRYEIPYSEHSSFSELCSFVRQVNPKKIIPSVGNSGNESAAAMLSLLQRGC